MNKEKLIDSAIAEKLKNNNSLGFSIDTAGDKKLKAILEPDRFVKKIDESNISVKEMMKYEKIARKLKATNAKAAAASPAEPSTAAATSDSDLNDMWDDAVPNKRLIVSKRKVASLVIPTSGLSYNPTFADHQTVIDEAIAIEDDEQNEKTLQKVKILRKKQKD